MIRYALACDSCEHEYEAWFASSDAYDRLSKAGEVECPACGSRETRKQIMAPTVARKDRAPADPAKMLEKLAAKARAHLQKTHDYVGSDFANEARAMHYGQKDERPIWGETTREEAEALAEEGVPALPIPEPFVPERKAKDELN